MQLDHIEVQNFRNIEHASVDFSPATNVLIGNNAQGKTNLIEAIYLLACGKSFRVARYRELLRHGETKANLSLQISGEGMPFQLKMILDAKEGKAIYKNGVKIHKLSEFLGLFRVVLFCPEHLSLIKDGPAKRRSFIDSAICQIRPYYASLLNEFQKVEAQRAALIKQSSQKQISSELLEIWEERLAKVSVKIALIRARYIRDLEAAAPVHFAQFSEGREELSLRYISDVYREEMAEEEMEARYRQILRESFPSDQKYGFTQKGVHRDDLEILVDAFPAKHFASQGQQRSAVLSLKLAEGEISKQMTGQDPVYLLDDVLSELDEKRRSYITAGLIGKQIILSGTDQEEFSFVKQKIFVEKGVFSR